MKAEDLKAGDLFKWKKGQVYYRPIQNTIRLEPEAHKSIGPKGKILVILDDCRQVILDPDHEVFIAS